MQRLMIGNLKGGVGKTVSSVSLAHGLAIMGKRVLLVDADPQGNSSDWLLANGAAIKFELADVLSGKSEFVDAIIAKVKDNLDMVCTYPDGDLRSLCETELARRPFFFEDCFNSVSSLYDFVVVDTSPSFSPLERSVCLAVDEVVVPLELEFFAVDGFGQFDRNIQEINRNWRRHIKIANILLTKENRSFSRHRLLLSRMQETKGYKFYIIRQDALIAESIGLHKTIFERDATSKSALDYMKVVEDMISGNF